MEIFEYLPQLIIAYDSNDKFANLIHVKKSNKNNDYFCPCCGGLVKPRAIDSNKEQSHYYHINGKCTKESQLHFFCKNWLFENGSKFYIENQLFEVKSIEIEKVWNTKFGNYKPDITVYTISGEIIYFEIFFTNRKTRDDYFCKWYDLGNSVVEINIKEYMYKTDKNTIPTFTYLYHDGKCFSKSYIKKDLYANTILRIKHELTRQKVFNYKARIEQLDWFWQKIINNASRDEILDSINLMNNEDVIFCYEVIKKKQCVKYLKNDILNIINQNVINEIRNKIALPNDENVYFDLQHYKGRTYEAGIRINVKTDHIIYDIIYAPTSIILKKNIFTVDEVFKKLNENSDFKEKIFQDFQNIVKYKNKLLELENDLYKFESNKYKIKIKNNFCTILKKSNDNNFKLIIKDYYIRSNEPNIDLISNIINCIEEEKYAKNFLDELKNNNSFLTKIEELENHKYFKFKFYISYKNDEYENYKENNSGLYVSFNINQHNIFCEKISIDENSCFESIEKCKKEKEYYLNKYCDIFSIIEEINNCKNKLWSAVLYFSFSGNLYIEITFNSNILNSNYNITCKNSTRLSNINSLSKLDIIYKLQKKMNLLLHESEEKNNYRIME